ncbi:MAG: hypothetical protein HFF77_03000 [Oscillospiraceae bacterium]|jgi:hypothetical protein|nr:hypothetical protein [Oscillospiraceae bacterium]
MSSAIEQAKRALCAALERAGLQAETAFASERAAARESAVAVVGLRRGESRGGGLSSYLGRRQEGSRWREVYGLRMELTLSLDLYAPAELGTEGCDRALETLHRVMLEGLPSGLRPKELCWEEAAWDQETAMFLRRGSLRCEAVFTAQAEEDNELVTDFILKGVVRQ